MSLYDDLPSLSKSKTIVSEKILKEPAAHVAPVPVPDPEIKKVAESRASPEKERRAVALLPQSVRKKPAIVPVIKPRSREKVQQLAQPVEVPVEESPTVPSASTQGFDIDPRLEYEPSRPNDYEAFCYERRRKETAGIRKKELDRALRRKEEERQQMRRERESAGRGRGRGVDVRPAWLASSGGSVPGTR